MTTPATRAELVEALIPAVRVWNNIGEARQQIEAILAAIEAHGVIPCPAEPAEEMYGAMAAAAIEGTPLLAAAIAASPYRRKEQGE